MLLVIDMKFEGDVRERMLVSYHRYWWDIKFLRQNPLDSQHSKKVVSDSPWLMDFAIRLVIFVLNLPNGPIKKFLGLVEMTFVLVIASFSLPEWQAVKLTFFALCELNNFNFQWTKTVYQNNFKHIAFFFYTFQGL